MPEEWRVGIVDKIIKLHDSKRKPLSSKERDKLEKNLSVSTVANISNGLCR